MNEVQKSSEKLRAMAKPFAEKGQDMAAPKSIDILLKMKIIIWLLEMKMKFEIKIENGIEISFLSSKLKF